MGQHSASGSIGHVIAAGANNTTTATSIHAVPAAGVQASAALPATVAFSAIGGSQAGRAALPFILISEIPI
jgi:hypothetical protein